MKKWLGALVLVACSTLPTKSAFEPMCPAPPTEWTESHYKGYLIDCTSDGNLTCCGYGFVHGADNDYCIHVLCAEDKCSGEWTYEATACPGPEPTKAKEEIETWLPDWEEGYYERT